MTKQNSIAGGTNSPSRAFRAVGLEPIITRKAKGAYLTDTKGTRYLDCTMGWGVNILGHAPKTVTHDVKNRISQGLCLGYNNPLENTLATLIVDAFPSIDQVRFVNSGSEAVMVAVRLARGATGRKHLILFDGCYHGHPEVILLPQTDTTTPCFYPRSSGILLENAEYIHTVPYNALQAVEKLFTQFPKDIAAVLLEPIPANMGVILPQKGFLEGLKKLTEKYSSLLIFDEVITGFRVEYGGAQTRYGIEPDITTLAKIIGGGLPIGAVGGKRELMQHFSPTGDVYVAGTFSGNSISMQAGVSTLQWLKKHKEYYKELASLTTVVTEQMQALLRGKGIAVTIQTVGSLFSFFFTNLESITNYDDAKTTDKTHFSQFYAHLLKQGVLLPPLALMASFLSFAHDEKNIRRLLKAVATYNPTT